MHAVAAVMLRDGQLALLIEAHRSRGAAMDALLAMGTLLLLPGEVAGHEAVDGTARPVADAPHSDILDGTPEAGVPMPLAMAEDEQRVRIGDIAADLDLGQPLQLRLAPIVVAVMLAAGAHHARADHLGSVASGHSGIG